MRRLRTSDELELTAVAERLQPLGQQGARRLLDDKFEISIDYGRQLARIAEQAIRYALLIKETEQSGRY